MTTEKTISKLCSVAPLIGDITEKVKDDETMIAWAKTYAFSKGDKLDNFCSILRIFPMLIAKCGEDVYGVIACLTDKNVEEVKAQDFGVTVNDVRGILSDEVFKSFFTLSLVKSNEKTVASAE